MWDLKTLIRLNEERCEYLRNQNKNRGRDVIKAESGPLAQLVEHRTFNPTVPGSSPGRLTKS